MCIGEYPNNITVAINNVPQDYTFSLWKTKVNNRSQMIFRGNVIVPMAGKFIAYVLLSNNGGEFLLKPTFHFGIRILPLIMVHGSSLYRYHRTSY